MIPLHVRSERRGQIGRGAGRVRTAIGGGDGRSKDLTVDELAGRVGKSVDHVQAVLDGYPNSVQRQTMLDTVDEIAASLGFSLNVT